MMMNTLNWKVKHRSLGNDRNSKEVCEPIFNYRVQKTLSENKAGQEVEK
jgi:hypothetical protein